MKKFAYSCLSIVLATTLVACGGGDKDDTPTKQQLINIGQFIGSSIQGVEGIEVIQDNNSLGMTSSLGQFTYVVGGGDLTFKIGKLTLGSAPAQLYITPTNLTNDPNKQTEILQILQTLDSDNDPKNGIQISKAQIDKLSNLKEPINVVDSKLQPSDIIKMVDPSKTIVDPKQAEDNFTEAQQIIKQEIIDKLEGYWRSSCIQNGETSSMAFGKFTKTDSPYISVEKVNYEYTTPDCSGNYDIRKEDNTRFDSSSITLTAKNQFFVEYENKNYGKLIKESYHRISEDKFNKASQALPTYDPTLDADRLIGYWKSDCAETKVTYLHITKQDDILYQSGINHTYHTKDCTGSSQTTEGSSEEVIISKDMQAKIKILSDDSFKINGSTFNRISANEFPKQ